MVHKNAKFSATLEPNRVLHYIFFNDCELTVDDFKETVAVYENFGEGQLLKVLAELPSHLTFSHDVLDYLKNREIPALAEAIVFNGLAHRLLFHFYMLFRSKKYPIKGFSNLRSAQNWLDTIKCTELKHQE